MAEILYNDFSGGWQPGIDLVKGPKNALLQMDNLELDDLGALQLAGGAVQLYGGLSAAAHTMFSRYLNGTRQDYSACKDGSVYRNNTTIVAPSLGDNSNAAFGTAFNFTLICSGSQRFKDNGSSLVNLGIKPPTVVPTIQGPYQPLSVVGNFSYVATPVGSSSLKPGALGNFPYLQLTCNASGNASVQTFQDPLLPYNSNSLVANGPNGITSTGYGLDSDTVIISGYTPIVTGRSLEIDFLLTAGDSAGDVVSDYYAYVIDDISQLTFNSQGVFSIKLTRSQFTRVGTGTQDWNTVYGFRVNYGGGAAGEIVNIIANWKNAFNRGGYQFIGGSNTQQGTYQYLQINVNNTGSYEALSVGGPITAPIKINNAQVAITPQAPTVGDVQANEAWIYRTGGNLGSTWYRVLVFNSATGFATAQFDSLSDNAAIELGITLNLNLLSVQNMPGRILDIIGPVSGRWYYFTDSFMYPSDINDPDMFDASLGVRTCGSASEVFMWARQLNTTTIVVGTSIDIYSLSGTFETLPDLTVDIYYLPMKSQFPPLTNDASTTNGSVFYLANDGWHSIGGYFVTNANNPNITAPTLDRLYRGENLPFYSAPNLKVAPGSTRFPVVIAKNRIYCFITGLATPRIEVYDLTRNYWRPVICSLGDVSAACPTPDGRVLACFNTNGIYEIDSQVTKLMGGSSPTIGLSFPFMDGGMPYQRKDLSTLKLRTTGITDTTLTLSMYSGGSFNNASVIESNLNFSNGETVFDLSQISALQLVKNYSFQLAGQCNVFNLQDLDIVFDARPIQRHYVKGLNNNYGTNSKKRVRVWPFILDTLGNAATITPYLDDVAQTPLTVNTTFNDTVNYYFTSDVQPVDLSYVIHSANLLEFYEALPPDVVQILPPRRQFSQVGPFEMFIFGKIKQLEIRALVYGTALPYTIFFNDTSAIQAILATTPNVDASYFIMLPKGTSGNILRVELGGPASPLFSQFYVKAQIARSSSERDTELEWIQLQ
jgi:hypothetical protein